MSKNTREMCQDDKKTNTTDHQVKVGWRGRLRQDPVYRHKVMRSVWFCLSFCSMGMQLSQTGPAFLDLQIITNTNVQQASAFLSADAAGSIIGALMAGPMYDLVSKTLLLLVSVLMLAVGTAVKPFCADFWLMVGISFGSSLFRASIAIVCSADMIRTWGEGEGQSAIQTMHFAFSVGALLSPLLTKPFLAPSIHALNYTRDELIEDVVLHSYSNTTTSISITLSSTVNASRENTSAPVMPAKFPLPETRIHIAFLIVASVIFLTAVPLAVDYVQKLKRRRRDRHSSSGNQKAINGVQVHQDQRDNSSPLNNLRSHVINDDLQRNSEDGTLKAKLATPGGEAEKQEDDTDTGPMILSRRPNLPRLPYLVTLATMCLYNMLQMGVELTFSSYLSNYVVMQMNWTKSEGAMVTFVFWICFTTSRLVAIFLVRAFSPLQDLVALFALLTAAFLAFLLASLWQLDWAVWVCRGVLGAVMSPMFPTTMTWIKDELQLVTGRVTSVLLVSGCSGSLINPLILGHLIEKEGAIWLSYLMLGEATMNTIVFVFISLFSRFYLQRRFPSTCRTAEIIITSDDRATKSKPSQPFLSNETSEM